MNSTLRLAALLLATALVGGCYTEPIEPGWFTPPAEKTIVVEPDDLGLTYQRLEIAAPAGYTIYGWLIPAANAPATVLINHGSVFNRGAYMAYYWLLHNLGYNVVIYDYRGFAESPGPASLDTLVPDADTVLAYLQAQPDPAFRKIVLYGISLGTLPTLIQASRSPAGVVGIILDGSFDRDSLPLSSYGTIGVLPIIAVVESLYAAYPELDPTAYVSEITVPKLFLQSPQDGVTPLAGALRLFELTPEPKEWCEVYGGHTMSPVLDVDYAIYVAAFLNRVAPTTGSQGQ